MSVVPFVGYLLRRVAVGAVLLLLLCVGVFGLLYLAPGSIEASVLGSAVRDPAAVAAVRAEYRLDDPLPVQFGSWLFDALRLDFGTSIRTGEQVGDLLAAGSGVALQLIGLALVMTLAAGIPLGVLAAVRRGSTLDRVVVGISVMGASAPTFAIGVFLLYVFGLQLGWFPIYGVGDGPVDRLHHLVLPAAALAFHLVALVVKVTRTAMIETLEQDYVEFARARGLPRGFVLRRYALRNALVPVLTASGLLITAFVSQEILAEVTFSLPGLGSLLVESIEYKDVPVVQAIALVAGALVIAANIVVDLLYRSVDPRIDLVGSPS